MSIPVAVGDFIYWSDLRQMFSRLRDICGKYLKICGAINHHHVIYHNQFTASTFHIPLEVQTQDWIIFRKKMKISFHFPKFSNFIALMNRGTVEQLWNFFGSFYILFVFVFGLNLKATFVSFCSKQLYNFVTFQLLCNVMDQKTNWMPTSHDDRYYYETRWKDSGYFPIFFYQGNSDHYVICTKFRMQSLSLNNE